VLPRPRPAHRVGLLSTALLSLLACASPATPDRLDATSDDAPFGATRDALPVREIAGCGGTAVSLTRRRITVIFAIDRSSSMQQSGLDGVAKWSALLRGLDGALPRIDADVAMGLVTYPQGRASSGSCDLRATLDEEPRLLGAERLLMRLHASGPFGPTPTRGALDVAGRWFAGQPDLGGERYVILATDGGPNCNATLDPTTCRCTNTTCAPRDATPAARTAAAGECLDDGATLASIRALRDRGVLTYVIGLEGVAAFDDVLSAMAVAGGRPREGAPRYYPASTSEALVGTLASITSGLVDCRFALDSAPPDPSLVDVRLDAHSLVRDALHRDGWDWSDDTHREIRFYGPTCDMVRFGTGGSRLLAAFGCPAPVPP
jgi:hypothetical protein